MSQTQNNIFCQVCRYNIFSVSVDVSVIEYNHIFLTCLKVGMAFMQLVKYLIMYTDLIYEYFHFLFCIIRETENHPNFFYSRISHLITKQH